MPSSMTEAITEYTELYISANTMVKAGAVGIKPIYKEDGHFSIPNNTFTDVVKVDAEQKVYSIWFPFNKVDKQGCIVKDPKVLEKALIDFLKNGKKEYLYTHDKGPNGEEIVLKADVCDLWIVQKGDPIFPELEGSLAGSVKFRSLADWETFKKLEWETSIEGKAKHKNLKKFDGQFEKGFSDELLRKEITSLTYVLEDTIRKAFRESDNPKEEIKKSISEYSAEVSKRLDSIPQPTKKSDGFFTKVKNSIFNKSNKEKTMPDDGVEMSYETFVKYQKRFKKEEDKKNADDAFKEKVNKTDEKLDALSDKFDEFVKSLEGSHYIPENKEGKKPVKKSAERDPVADMC